VRESIRTEARRLASPVPLLTSPPEVLRNWLVTAAPTSAIVRL